MMEYMKKTMSVKAYYQHLKKMNGYDNPIIKEYLLQWLEISEDDLREYAGHFRDAKTRVDTPRETPKRVGVYYRNIGRY